MISKKSIVLSDVKNNSNKKAVLTLERKEDDIVGSVRFYNFPSADLGLLTLGFYCKNRVIKSGLTYKSNSYYTFLLSEDFLEDKFSCAVIEFKEAEAIPILYGASEGRDENVYASIISELSGNSSMQNVQKVLDENGIDFDDDEKEEIESEIDKCMECENCANCFYKKYFYENEKVESGQDEKILSLNSEEKEQNSGEDIVNEIEEPQSAESFIGKLKPQIDKLFEKNPIEKNLEELIPNSKFVKIEYEDDGDFYVFGIIYEGGNIKYVCYGVPAVYEEEPPNELSGYPTFLPLNKEEKEGFGYWLTYQDAETGEPIKAVID